MTSRIAPHLKEFAETKQKLKSNTCKRKYIRQCSFLEMLPTEIIDKIYNTVYNYFFKNVIEDLKTNLLVYQHTIGIEQTSYVYLKDKLTVYTLLTNPSTHELQVNIFPKNSWRHSGDSSLAFSRRLNESGKEITSSCFHESYYS